MLNNSEKSKLYDDYLFESDKLQRINSKLKSEYVTNIPDSVQKTINENNVKIAFLVKKLEELFR